MAELLANKVSVSRVFHSGKTRALQTAEIFTAIIAGEFPVESINGLGPNDSPELFANLLMGWDEDVLVVGHLPFLSRLVSLLISKPADTEVVSFVPGSIVFLESMEDGHFQIQWMLRPELLRNGETVE